MALYGTYAIIDQVATDAAHRRKGLGSVVMHHLSQHAVAQGANTGVLVATEDVLALYRRLGWELHSPVTAAVIAA